MVEALTQAKLSNEQGSSNNPLTQKFVTLGQSPRLTSWELGRSESNLSFIDATPSKGSQKPWSGIGQA